MLIWRRRSRGRRLIELSCALPRLFLYPLFGSDPERRIKYTELAVVGELARKGQYGLKGLKRELVERETFKVEDNRPLSIYRYI